jgi:hypothetical protein
MVRVNHDVEVVQLGDLGDFRIPSQTNDSICWSIADRWLDVVLWGNHERPVIGGMAFGGYYPPLPEVKEKMLLMRHENRLKLAHAAHGFLLTHAGMPEYYFGNTRTGSLKRSDAEAVARWLNRKDRDQPHKFSSAQIWMLRDAIGPGRGGMQRSGGLLWRDDFEDELWDGLPQVYGHTSDKLIRLPQALRQPAYNVDLSKHGAIGAVWLPEQRAVTVRDEDILEVDLVA